MAEGETPTREMARPEISGSITGVVVGYVRLRSGPTGVERLLHLSGDARDVAELEDPARWSSYAQALRLFDAAVEVSGDPDIARAIGAHLLNQHAGTEVAALLRSLGSTRALLENIAVTASKYSTVTQLDVVELSDEEALVAAVTRAPIVRSRHFCLYTAGVLSQASVLFGHDPAVVDELECQRSGHGRCLYRVRWVAESEDDPARRIEHLETQLTGLHARFEALQSTATAFVSASSPEQVLATVTRRAGLAVRAPQFLLAVQMPDERHLRLHHEGFASEADAAAVADALLAGDLSDRPTHLVVDVLSATTRYGVLAAIQPTGSGFFPQERQLLEAYAAHAAAALEVAAALDEARRQNETARALLAFGRSLAAAAGTAEITERLVAILPSLVRCDSGAVLLWDADAGVLRLRGVFGVPVELEDAFLGLEIRPEDTPAVSRLLEQREPLFIDGASTDDPLLQGLMAAAVMRGAAVVPILGQDHVLGVVAVGRAEGTIDAGSDVVERLAGIADQTATALVNAQLLEAVQTEALHDPLTGLANARLLSRAADAALAATTSESQPVALLFVDLDRFKPINDELGHDAGDEVLRQCGRRLKAAVRQRDMVARLGGDEFVVLMPGADHASAANSAARLEEALSAPIDVEGQTVQVTASIGVAVHDAAAAELPLGFRALLKQADVDMYQTKATRTASDT